MQVQKYTVTATTDGSGDATVYLPSSAGDAITGRVLTMIYTKTDFTDGVDFTITSLATGQTIWTESNVNATATRAPGQQTHTGAGVAITDVYDYIALVNDRIKIVVASGGATHTGAFTAIIG